MYFFLFYASLKIYFRNCFHLTMRSSFPYVFKSFSTVGPLSNNREFTLEYDIAILDSIYPIVAYLIVYLYSLSPLNRQYSVSASPRLNILLLLSLFETEYSRSRYTVSSKMVASQHCYS